MASNLLADQQLVCLHNVMNDCLAQEKRTQAILQSPVSTARRFVAQAAIPASNGQQGLSTTVIFDAQYKLVIE